MKRKSYDPIPKKRRYFMLVALVVIVVLVCYQIWDVSYSYSIRGEKGVIGLSGYLLWFLFTYISFELTFAIRWRSGDFIPFLLFVVAIPMLIVLVVYPKWFNNYSEDVKKEMLRESHIKIGYVYNIRTPIGRGAYHKEIKVGVDKDYKSKHKISNEMFELRPINIGDTILLRISDEYPRVTEVLNWFPSKEEIERYKVPRKFKSYVNGKIEEEEE